jgi:hypothetical protein
MAEWQLGSLHTFEDDDMEVERWSPRGVGGSVSLCTSAPHQAPDLGPKQQWVLSLLLNPPPTHQCSYTLKIRGAEA